VVTFPGVRAREQPGVGLPVVQSLLRPRERLEARCVGRQLSERVARDLDRLVEAPDVEVDEREQQRGVVRCLPVVRRQLVAGGAVEDLAAPVLRLGERLARSVDLAQAAYAVEVRRAELRRRDGGSIRPAEALLAPADLGELQRVVVAGVRVRRHQARRDALVAHAHVLDRAIRRERLPPDRQVRLGVHRRLADQRQHLAAVDLAVDQARDIAVAARDEVVRIELEDPGIERARLVAQQLGEDAEERDGQARRRLRHRLEARDDLGHREALGGEEEVVELEVGERRDQGQAARSQPLREALRQLLRQRKITRSGLAGPHRRGVRGAPLLGAAVGAAGAQGGRARTGGIEAELEPQHLVAARHPEEPVERLLGGRVIGVEEAAALVDEPLVVMVAEGQDRVTDEVVEHDHRQQPGDVGRQSHLLLRGLQPAREERRAVRIRKGAHGSGPRIQKRTRRPASQKGIFGAGPSMIPSVCGLSSRGESPWARSSTSGI
jgi:hypothetical protein